MKSLAIEREKIFAKQVYDKESAPHTHKELL